MATVREIASRAGVSKTTVSLVLNNKEGVSAELRRRVLDAVKSMGTTRVNVRDDRPTSVVLLHSHLGSTQFFRDILQGVQNAADRLQIQLRLMSVNRAGNDIIKSHLYFSDRQLRPDGVLVVASGLYDLYLEQLQQLKLPAVLVGGPTLNPSLSVVTPNETQAGYEATSYLINLGHRAIAFVSEHLSTHYARERCAGYQQALRDAGITPDSGWQVISRDPATMQAALAAHPEITALMFANEANAYPRLPLLPALGYRIPDDISVLMFDEVDYAQEHQPPLTTMAYPLHQEGYWALKMLVDHIREPEIECYQMRFRTRIIERESCAAPRT